MECFDCKKRLTDKIFLVDGKFYCEESYESLFVRVCGGCGEKADPKDHLIKTSAATWHVDCFKCSHPGCGIKLAELTPDNSDIVAAEFIIDEDGALLCEKHAAKQKKTAYSYLR